jgi:biopolymer transport protein ExbB/TolQ
MYDTVSVYKGDSGINCININLILEKSEIIFKNPTFFSLIDWIGSVETYTQLRLLQKNARELRSEMRSLRRLSQSQLSAVKEAVKDTIQIMKKTFLENSEVISNALCDSHPSTTETTLKNVHRQEDNYQKEMKQLEKDLRYLNK